MHLSFQLFLFSISASRFLTSRSASAIDALMFVSSGPNNSGFISGLLGLCVFNYACRDITRIFTLILVANFSDVLIAGLAQLGIQFLFS